MFYVLFSFLASFTCSFLVCIDGVTVPNSRDLGTLITCLKTARSAGLMSLNKNTLSTGENVCMWCGVVPVELMKKALCHLDDQVNFIVLEYSSPYSML